MRAAAEHRLFSSAASSSFFQSTFYRWKLQREFLLGFNSFVSLSVLTGKLSLYSEDQISSENLQVSSLLTVAYFFLLGATFPKPLIFSMTSFTLLRSQSWISSLDMPQQAISFLSEQELDQTLSVSVFQEDYTILQRILIYNYLQRFNLDLMMLFILRSPRRKIEQNWFFTQFQDLAQK